MDNVLYNIQKTQCSYDGRKVVLDIEHLTIPQGEIIFFVGPSGVGKSTILETLGMMNNTILSSSVFEYKGQDMTRMWNFKHRHALSLLRNNDFSFIFQQNNLMHNFSAYENAMTAALFQGLNENQTRLNVRNVFSRLGLPVEDRYIHEYSGGQQQRISFARAIIPHFSVLFGDEPTGNLDSFSANNLIGVLVEVIREKRATAIIVSHDIRLALKYADMIVQIQKCAEVNNPEQIFGKINEDSIYIRDEKKWNNINKNFTEEDLFTKLIKELQ